MKAGLPVVPAVVLSVLGTAALAVLIGWPVTQLRGHYVAVATLALALIVVDVANREPGPGHGHPPSHARRAPADGIAR